jgi:hypothetical protein
MLGAFGPLSSQRDRQSFNRVLEMGMRAPAAQEIQHMFAQGLVVGH